MRSECALKLNVEPSVEESQGQGWTGSLWEWSDNLRGSLKKSWDRGEVGVKSVRFADRRGRQGRASLGSLFSDY